MSDREFDIIVYGASGFTGRLVAEYLSETYGQGDSVTWAMAGRNETKLADVRAEIGAPEQTALIVADAADLEALKNMAARARVVITSTGPFQLYGSPLVEACAATGTDYVDLSGEPVWMADMIAAHDAAAKASGARIVHSCGFDSIPFDLGVWFLQEEAQKRFGAPTAVVHGRVRAMNGKLSGGTVASGKATMVAAMQDPAYMARLRDPFLLADGFTGPRQPGATKPREDESLGVWLAPFMMAPINTKNIHRSNALLGHAYGEDFTYDEMLITGPGEKGRAIAEHLAASPPGSEPDAPEPGEGPNKEEREAGSYDLLFIGEGPEGQALHVGVTGDRDPGYGSTAKMIAEAALCLINDVPDAPGGVLTPVPVMAEPLLVRMREKAGLTFTVEN